MSFLQQVFSDNGQGSASRVMTLLTVITSCVGFIHTVWVKGVLPDALTMGGLGVFAICPYTVNQIRNAISDVAGAKQQGGA